MTQDEVRRCEDMLDMFATPGWAHLIEDLTETAQEQDSILGLTDAKSLHIRQGQLMAVTHILSLEDTTRRVLDEDEAI